MHVFPTVIVVESMKKRVFGIFKDRPCSTIQLPDEDFENTLDDGIIERQRDEWSTKTNPKLASTSAEYRKLFHSFAVAVTRYEISVETVQMRAVSA